MSPGPIGNHAGHPAATDLTPPASGPQLLTDPAAAAAVLAAGGLVGLPTETVYGLAADAANPAAVARVFAVKGRPTDHPLIVHLAAARHLRAWAPEAAPELLALAERHWPGPLTIVVPKADWVPSSITGGQPTVAIRVPGHPVTRDVIRLFGAAIGDDTAGVVAPSANVFGQVSPTTVEHVRQGLADRLTARDALLDGGRCDVGVESTIVAWVAGQVRVLRPGAIGIDPSAVGAMADPPRPATAGAGAATPRVPGSLSSHYAPRARVVLVADAAELEAVAHLVDGPPGGATGHSPPAGLLAPASAPTPPGWLRLAAPPDSAAYARELYDALRRADDAGLNTVVAVPPRGADALVEAVVDRLTRAAAGGRARP